MSIDVTRSYGIAASFAEASSKVDHIRARRSIHERRSIEIQRRSLEGLPTDDLPQPILTKAEIKEEEDLGREIDMNEHTISLPELLARLDTRLTGRTAVERTEILRRDGPNALTPPATEPEWKKFLKCLTGIFSLLLWGGSILSIAAYYIPVWAVAADPTSDMEADIGNLYIGIILAVVVLITGVFTYMQEKSSQDVMAGFANMIPTRTMVLVDGQADPVEIDAKNLVAGDVVHIKLGDKIPADVRIVESRGFKVDNSSLTGESEPQARIVECTSDNPLETKNLAFFGTLAIEGSAVGLVISTGDRTVIGQIARLATSTGDEETPLHHEIESFVQVISLIAATLAVVFFVVDLVNSTENLANRVKAGVAVLAVSCVVAYIIAVITEIVRHRRGSESVME
jgi:sodium/potassium-transporting ATPase subunit alpha